jgi:hypothetical protein
MKNFFEGQKVGLRTVLLLSICIFSTLSLDDDFDHLFEEYNDFREKQNDKNGEYYESDGDGLTLTQKDDNINNRELVGTGIIGFFYQNYIL